MQNRVAANLTKVWSSWFQFHSSLVAALLYYIQLLFSCKGKLLVIKERLASL